MIVYLKPGLIFVVGRRNGERRANRQKKKRNQMNRCLEYEDWSLNLITEFKSYLCKYNFLKFFSESKLLYLHRLFLYHPTL